MPQSGRPFDPVFDIYHNHADYAQGVAERYMGYQPYLPGMDPNSQDQLAQYRQSYQGGYFKYQDSRNWMTSMGGMGISMFTGRTALPHNNRTMRHNIEVLDNARSYSMGRSNIIQQAAFDQFSQMMRNTAAQRGWYVGQERMDQMAGAIQSPYGGMALSMLASSSPEMFESAFGLAGSGVGMYDTAYSASTMRRNADGSRFTGQQRAAYGSQAMNMLYWDPRQRQQRRTDSLQGGELWSYMGSHGLLGRHDASIYAQSQEEIISDVSRYMVENDIYAGTDPGVKAHQERLQKAHAVNVQRDKIRKLSEQRSRASLDPSQRAQIQAEMAKEIDTLGNLERSIGLPGQQAMPMPGDMSGASRAVGDLIRHRGGRSGFRGTSGQYAAETARLETAVRDQLAQAGVVAAPGSPIDITSMGTDDLITMMDATKNAEKSRRDLAAAESKIGSAIGRDEIKEILTAGQDEVNERLNEIGRIESDDDRTDDPQTSARRLKIEEEVARMKHYQSQGNQQAADEHRRRAIEAAGGGQAGATIVFQESKRQGKESVDINLNQPGDLAFGQELVTQQRLADRDALKSKVFGDLSTAGLEGKVSPIDTSELKIDGMLSFQDALMSIQNDPKLARWSQNAASIRAGERKWAEYEKALVALQESMTNPYASPSQMMEVMRGFSGGNLQQVDPTQLQHNIRKTFALARDLGQGDEYVMDTMRQAGVAASQLGLNEQFTTWFGQTSMANHLAARDNPAFSGVWGARYVEQVKDMRNRNYQSWVASDSGNQYARALRIQETLGKSFVEGSSAANLMRALQTGQSTFEEVYTDSDGTTKTRTRSTQLSETEHQRIIASGFGNSEDFQTASALHANMKEDRYANQQILYKHQNELLSAADAQQTAPFVTGVARRARHATSRGRWAAGAADSLAAEGIGKDATGRFLSQMTAETMDQMLDSVNQERIATKYGINAMDTDYHGQVAVRMQMERLDEIISTSDPASEEYRMAKTLRDQLGNDQTFRIAASEANVSMDALARRQGSANATSFFQQHDKVLNQGTEENLINADMDSYADSLYSGIKSNKMVARIADQLGQGATPTDILFSAMEVYNVGEDSPLRNAMEDFRMTSDRLRELRLERSRISNNTSLSEADKQARLAEIDENISTAEQNMTDSQILIAPLLEKAVQQAPTDMTDTELARKLGMDLDTMSQYYGTTETGADGKQYRRNRIAGRDNIRVDDQGVISVMVNGQFQAKDDVAYFGQRTAVDEAGNEAIAYQQIKRNKKNNGWIIQDEKGKWVDYDHTVNRVSAGNAVYGSNKAGKIGQTSNLVWSPEGVLMKTLEDGSFSEVLDAKGVQITRESQQGNLIASGKMLYSELESLAEGTVDESTWYSFGQRGAQLATSSRPSDLSNEAIMQRRIHAAANLSTDSTSAIVQIDPEKVKVKDADGKEREIYMVAGSQNEDAQKKALSDYMAIEEDEKKNVEAYFKATDREAAKFGDYAADRDMQNRRRAYKMMENNIGTLNTEISTLEELLAAEQDPGQREQIESDIATRKAAITATESSMEGAIGSTASTNAHLKHVKQQGREINEAQKKATSTKITNAALLAAIHEVGGKRFAGRDTFTQGEMNIISGLLKGSKYGVYSDTVKRLSWSGQYAAADEAGKAKMTNDMRSEIEAATGIQSEDLGKTVHMGEGAPVEKNDTSQIPKDPTKKGPSLPVSGGSTTGGGGVGGAVASSPTGAMGSSSLPPVQNCDLNAGTVNLTVNSMNLTNGSIAITGTGDGAHAGSAATKHS